MIRRAEGRDAAPLAALLRALNTGDGRVPARMTAQGVARDLIGDARVVVLLAAPDGLPAGFVTGHPFYDSKASRWGCIMNDLYVAPEARRQGLGRGLVSALARAVAEDGGEFLRWHANEGDLTALAFHQGIGAQGGRTHDFLLDGAGFAALTEAA